jgi:hypothetical protein
MRSFILLFLCECLLIASCKSSHKISKKDAAGLDTITNINQLSSKNKAIYKNDKGELYLMKFEPGLRDSIDENEESDSIQIKSGRGDFHTVFTIIPVNERCDSDNFDGSNRKKAKTSISPAGIESFNTLTTFVNSLEDAETVAAAIPGSNSLRIAAEDRNVRIKKAYLYCYSRQTDEDFHVIIGSTKKQTSTTKFFNIEISGLPPATDASFPLLQAARDSFFRKASKNLCSAGYFCFTTPLKIEVEGSLFFDKQHHNGLHGTGTKRPPDAWEIHPITFLNYK